MTDSPKIGPRKRRLSMDDIETMLSEIASDRSDPVNQMRAIKALTGIKTQEAVLPEPLTEGELVARMGRLMSGCGVPITGMAYFNTFKFSIRNTERAKELEMLEKVAEAADNYPHTVRAFYKRYPEFKAKKVPAGFPSGGSIERKREWLKQQCIKLDVERAHKELQAVTADLGRDQVDGRKLYREAQAREGMDAGEGPILGKPTELQGLEPPVPAEYEERAE